MKAAIRKFIISFRTNNNTRLFVCWLGVLIIFIANLVIFGIGASSEPETSGTAQKYYNLYNHGKFLTDSQMTGIKGSFYGAFSWMWDTLRWFAWFFWFLLLGWSIIYIPIAFSDEAHLAWQKAKRLITEKEEVEGELPATETGQPRTVRPAGERGETSTSEAITGKLFEQMRIFGREFFAAVVADVLSKKRR